MSLSMTCPDANSSSPKMSTQRTPLSLAYLNCFFNLAWAGYNSADMPPSRMDLTAFSSVTKLPPSI